MRIYFLLIVATIISLPVLRAQTTIQPERLTIEDGLSQGFVDEILQDHEGFLWFGTKNGLNRYDGEQFEIFTNNPADPYSISHDWVTNLYEVGDYLLVGTAGGGLNIFHKQSKRFYKIPAANAPFESWSTMSVMKILMDNLDQLWILEERSGLVIRLQFPENFWQRLAEEEQLLKEVQVLVIPDLSLIAIVKNGDTLYGVKYPNQLMKININSGEWESVQNQPPDLDLLTIVPNIKEALLVYVYGNDDILFLKNGNWQTCTTDFEIRTLFYLENEHQLWVHSGHDLLIFDEWVPDGQSISRADATVIISSSRDNYTQMLQDRSGIIWVGTDGYGILKIAPRLLKIKTYFDGMSIISSPFMTRDGGVIMSTAERTILKTPLHSVVEDFLHGVWWFEDTNGTLWLVGKLTKELMIYQMNNLNQLQKKAVFGSDIFNRHTAAMDSKTGILWVANPTGSLIRYTLSTNRWNTYNFKHLFYSSYDCYAITQTANGHWWIGTSRGLVQGVPNGNNFDFELIQTKEGEIEGLLNNEVASLLTDPNDANTLWIGTKGGGLHRLDTKSMTFTHLTSENGLPNDVIYGVLNDNNGNLWMSSNKGIIYYNPATGVIRNFTKADGLQSNEFNTWAYAKSRTGELMFGGINGLNVFHPDDLKENAVVPKVWLTRLEVDNQRIIVGDSTKILNQAIEFTSEITLLFSQNSFTLEFAALEFSTPLKNRFRYYLEGAEKPWVHENTNNNATYLNLSPGRYTFKLKGSNGDRVWNEQATQLNITILAPWFRSNLAYLFYALLIGLGIWTIMKFWQNRFRLNQEIELEHKEAARLKKLDIAKSRLYTNITHEFRTPLTVISGITEQLKGNEESKILIKRNSDQLLNLVNQMLDLRKIESGEISIQNKQDNIVKLIRYLTESIKSYAKLRGLSIHFLSDEKSLLMDFDEEKITRIHSNLMSNAIKFTPEGGDIYVQLSVGIKDMGRQFIMKIKDTGVGIAADKLARVFDRFYQVDDSATRQGEGTGIGLTLVSELVKAMNGDVKVSSSVGEGLPAGQAGTTFILTLPITNIAALASDVPDKEISNTAMIDTVLPAKPSPNQAQLTDSSDQSKPIVLIVEDNADVIHYLINCLKENHSIEIAMDGEEGIEKAISTIPDIIVSDVMMPIKDGFELCQTLKTDERTSHIPIILLTAKADMESRLEGLQRGADAYLSKPFHREELQIILQSQLALRKKLQRRFSQISDQILPNELANDLGNKEIEIQLETEDAFLKKIRDIIEIDLSDSEIDMTHLVRKIGMSRSQIFKKVKALTGRSPSVYINSIRLYHAQKLLKTTDLNVSEVAYEVGFTSPPYFSKLFLDEFGTPPSETHK